MLEGRLYAVLCCLHYGEYKIYSRGAFTQFLIDIYGTMRLTLQLAMMFTEPNTVLYGKLLMVVFTLLLLINSLFQYLST